MIPGGLDLACQAIEIHPYQANLANVYRLHYKVKSAVLDHLVEHFLLLSERCGRDNVISHPWIFRNVGTSEYIEIVAALLEAYIRPTITTNF